MLKRTNKLIVLSTLLLSSQALAEQCNIALDYGVIVEPEHIRILEDDKTHLQINGENQLFIQGIEIQLNAEQKQLLNEYTAILREQLPSMVAIAIEGVDIAIEAVNKVITSFTGENSSSHQKFQNHFDEFQWALRKRFNQSEDSFYLAPQKFDKIQAMLLNEIEQELENFISESFSTILVAVGEAISKREKEQQENNISFHDKMDKISKDLKFEVGSKVEHLEIKAAAFCQQLEIANKIENQLRNEISELKTFDLIKVN